MKATQIIASVTPVRSYQSLKENVSADQTVLPK